MSSKIVASAPGKVLLSGEYAVLDGAAAICMAVNRRARATLVEIDGDMNRVTAAAYTDEVGQFQSIDGSVHWQSGRRQFEVVDAVWRAIEGRKDVAQVVDLDTSQFIDAETSRKTGIGSSAAITVALCAALKGSIDIKSLAQRAHRALQGGVGSGVDVACSIHGGLIHYRMDDADSVGLDWPIGLHFRVIWTGVTSSTQEKLAKLEAGVSKSSRIRLARAAEKIALAWRVGQAARIVDEYHDYTEYLRAFNVDHKLGIFDAGHEELCRTASVAGLAYKPCGAGGGDVGILLGTDAAALDAFTGMLPTACSVLDCETSPMGVRIEA